MRLFGLASGFDTEAMVQNMMRVERIKVDRYTQRKQINQWRQQDYNKINNSIANFILNSKKNVGLSKTSSTGSIKNQSWKSLDYVKKASSTNEDIATAKVIGNAASGRFTVNVEQIAEDMTYVSGVSAGEKIYRTDKLEEELIIDGESIIKAGASIDQAIKAINNNDKMKDRNISAFFDSGTGRIFIQGDSTGKEIEIKGLESFKRDVKVNQNLDFSEISEEDVLEKDLTIDGKLIAKAGDKLTDIRDAINGDNLENEKVKEIRERLSHIDNTEISIDEGKIKATKFLSIDKKSIKSTIGQTARISVNGVEIESASNEINFNGLEINIKELGETIIDVSTNTEGIIDKIKGLVDEYNSLLDEITKKTTEKRDADYHPLSKEEKEAMSDRDVELWEEKAKAGLLQKDETINRMLSKVRGDLYKNVEGLEGSFKNITQIGITTMRWDEDPVGGKLQIDEDKLRAALEEDAEGVMELMFGEGKKGAESESTSAAGSTNKGLFTGIYDNLIDGMKDIVNVSGPGDDAVLLRSVRSNLLTDFVTSKGSISDIDRSIADMEKKIANIELMLQRKEDNYYAQFSRMEKAIYEMNSQSQWMMNQMMM